MALGDLCTTAQFRAYARIAAGNEDGLIATLISSASKSIAKELGVSFDTTSFVETYDGNGRQSLPLDNKPIVSVATVLVDGVSIPARATPLGTGFFFTINVLYLAGYCFSKGMQNVVVTYATSPLLDSDLAQACMMIVDYWYKEHDRSGIRSKTMMSGETIVYDKSAWPQAVQQILDNNRSPGLLA